MADVKVEITQELVERATQRDSRHCMIAEAIQAARPKWKNITVDLATIRWTNPKTGKRYICLTPPEAGQALVEFDQGRPVQPFAVSLTVMQSTPTSVAKQGKRKLVLSAAGKAKIEGGRPLPEGHLRGGANIKTADRAAKREAAIAREEAQLATASGGEGNVKLSSSRYREYGRRLLKA